MPMYDELVKSGGTGTSRVLLATYFVGLVITVVAFLLVLHQFIPV